MTTTDDRSSAELLDDWIARRTALESTSGKLDAELRRILEACRRDGMTLVALGEVLGVSPQRVHQLTSPERPNA